MRKLPVFRSFKEVFAGVTRHYFDLIRIAPGGVGLLLSGYLVLIISGDFPGMMDEQTVATGSMFNSLPKFVTFAIALVAVYFGTVAAAVRWHRFVLLGERPHGAISVLFFWGKDQFRYLWTTIKLGFVWMLISGFVLFLVAFAGIAGTNVTGAGTEAGKSAGKTTMMATFSILYFVLVYLSVRMSLAFPDAALGLRGRIGDAFERTTGNGWRLLAYSLLVQISALIGLSLGTFAFGMLAGRYGAILGGAESDLATKVTTVLTLPLVVFQSMLTITMLSVAYREIVGLPGTLAVDLEGADAPVG